MKTKLIANFYWPADQVTIQGDAATIAKKARKLTEQGYYYQEGGNGTEIWVRPVKCNAHFIPEGGEELSRDVKNLVKDYYSISRINEKRFNSFCDLWRKNTITVDYNSDKDELKVM